MDAVEIVNALGARWADGFDGYVVTGDARVLICVLCRTGPCSCPPFGTSDYLALVHQRHGVA